MEEYLILFISDFFIGSIRSEPMTQLGLHPVPEQ